MKQLIKCLLFTGAIGLVGFCFTVGILDGMAKQDRLLDAQRKQRCKSWGTKVKPAECALVWQQEQEEKQHAKR